MDSENSKSASNLAVKPENLSINEIKINPENIDGATITKENNSQMELEENSLNSVELCTTEATSGVNTIEQQNLALPTENPNSDGASINKPNSPNSTIEENVDLDNTQSAQIASNCQEENLCQQQIKAELPDEDCQQNNEKDVAPPSFTTVVVKSEPGKNNLVGVKNFITKSSLGLLAQYDSDSDKDTEEDNQATIADDDVVEVPIEANKDYRDKVVEIKSESESDSSSDSDVEYIAKIRKEIEKRIDLEDEDDIEDDDDDESAGKNKKKKAQSSMRVKGELGLEDLPPIQDLHITVPEEECIVLGTIHSIVDQLLLVSAIPDSTLYDLDTVLFLDKGKRVLGEVFDVLGQVADPLYCVRFNSCKDIEEKGIKVGDTVYVAPKTEHTQFVIISSLMKLRGSDASWENDIEPPPRYLDYSDDEQEREARQRIRNKDRSANKDYEDHDEATKRARDDLEETASVSSMASTEQTQTRHPQRGGRFNRGNTHRTPHEAPRSRYNNQSRNPHQMSHNPNAGSWHSNYHRPYSYNSHMAMPPMPHMPQPMNPSYPMFPQYPTFPPTMAAPPYPQTMYAQNPYAMYPPQLLPQVPPRSRNRSSPSPPPPGLE